MRALTEEEMKAFFEKLANFIGPSIKDMLDRSDQPHVFRLHKDRVYYVSEHVLKGASAIGRKELALLGTCFGKFSGSGKFRLHITCLDYLAQYAKHKVWVKPAAEMSFLYGNHVLKAGVGRVTDGVQQHCGVVVVNMADVPLGFGVMSKSGVEIRGFGPTDIVVLHQADIGEFLRDEDTGFATGGKLVQGQSAGGDGSGSDNTLVRRAKRLGAARLPPPQKRAKVGNSKNKTSND